MGCVFSARRIETIRSALTTNIRPKIGYKQAKYKKVVSTCSGLGPQMWVRPINRVMTVMELLDRLAYTGVVIWCANNIGRRLVENKLRLHCFDMKNVWVLKDSPVKPLMMKNINVVIHYDPPNSISQYLKRQSGPSMRKPTSFCCTSEDGPLMKEIQRRRIPIEELNWFDFY